MNDDALTLSAALCPPDQALEAWLHLLNGRAFDSLDGKIYRALPTVYANLRALDKKVPCLEQLKGTARHAWAENIFRLRALLPLLQRLHKENLDYRLLKGAAIACLTNSWSTRVMGDVDILVHKKDTPKILEILDALGSKQKFNLSKNFAPTLHETWVLNLHHYATDLDIHVAHMSDKSIFGKMLSCEARLTQYQDVSIKTPDAEWLLIHSALHGKLEMSRTDPLQSILDAARLLPMADLNRIQKKATDVEAADIIESMLCALPAPSPEVSRLIQDLRPLSLKSSKRRRIRKLLSRNVINIHNIRKLIDRRPGPNLLMTARTETKGKKWLYWGWLKLGQLNSLEHICIEKFGGFLDLPAKEIAKGEVITIAPKSTMQPDRSITTGSIMGHDFRVKIRLPKGVRQLTVFIEYQFLFSTYLGLYINGTPLGVLPLPGTRSGSFPIITNDNLLEISLRSPCNRNEEAIDFIGIRCEWG